jgi:hypothetical protein
MQIFTTALSGRKVNTPEDEGEKREKQVLVLNTDFGFKICGKQKTENEQTDK